MNSDHTRVGLIDNSDRLALRPLPSVAKRDAMAAKLSLNTTSFPIIIIFELNKFRLTIWQPCVALSGPWPAALGCCNESSGNI